MGDATLSIKDLLERITGSKPDYFMPFEDKKAGEFIIHYSASRLNAMVLSKEGDGKKQVVVYYHANFVRYTEHVDFIQNLLQETGLEWGTPDLNPDKVVLSRQWPDHNRERAFLMAKFKGDFDGLEEKASAIYNAGNRLIEKVGEK